MIKSAIVVVGILLLLFVAYIGWVLHSASSTAGFTPLAQADVLADKVRVTITFPGVEVEHQITEVLFPRDLGEELGLSAPPELSLTPYTLDDTENPGSDESVTWVEEANQKDIRWLGSTGLLPDIPTVLDFPIRRTISGEGLLRFQYERKLGMGGQISFFYVRVLVAEN